MSEGIGADQPALPTQEQLRALSRWAVVAFAARCARRVLPVYEARFDEPAHSPKDQHRAEVVQAVQFSETAAAHAVVNDAIANDVTTAAGNAYDGVMAMVRPAPPNNATTALTGDPFPAIRANIRGAVYLAASAATLTAYRAAYATRAASFGAAETDDSANAAADAARVATAAAETPVLRKRSSAAIWRDYELLLAASRGNEDAKPWDDHTPVPPEFFGPLWPEGVPEGWPETASDESASGPHLLEIEIVVPKGMTPEQSREFNERVAKFYAALSGAHAAMGGGGLRILDEGSCETADVEDEAPSDADCRGPLIGAGGGR